MFKKFLQNTRKPSGLSGRIMINMMNSGHSKISKWGFSHISIKDNYDVLDIGCGGGKNIKTWLELCPKGKITGIDYSIESVKKSKEVNKSSILEGRCNIIESNVANMPFSEESFDIVSAFETIYFWPDIQNTFSSVYKILKPNGKFMIINEVSDSRGEKWENIIEGMKIYTESDLRELLENSGFNIVLTDKDKDKGWLAIIASKK